MIAAKKPSKPGRSLLGAALLLTVLLPPPSRAQPEPPPAETAPASSKKGSTTVTAEKEATFDNEARKASFAGNVKVTDPEFQLTCDNLVIFLSDDKKEGPAKPGQSSSALTRAVADGNVVVLQRRTADDGSEKIYRGKAEHGVYDAVREDFTLTGWPQVQQGFNSHVATEEGTIMVIRKDGQMVTKGGSRTEIQETTDEP